LNEDKLITVKHKQADGEDWVRIYAPSGAEVEIGYWPIQGDPLESAVEALWAAYEKACELAPTFKTDQISIYSAVPGAIERFAKEHEEAAEGADE
jgi:hypothetical protein